MSLKKILAVVMASAMAIGTFAAHALTLDVAEAANETIVAEDAVLAAEEETVNTLVPGSYDSNWNLVKDWDTLVKEGLVTYGNAIYGEGYEKWLVDVDNSIEYLVIDGGSVEVLYNTFSGNAASPVTGIKGIKMTEGVKTIMYKTFNYATNLKTIELADSVETILAKAFLGTGLETATMYADINYIDERYLTDMATFRDSKIKTLIIEDGVKSIPAAMFRDCKDLESVVIPASVKSIGDRAFYDCLSLKTVTILGSDVEIGSQVFDKNNTNTEYGNCEVTITTTDASVKEAIEASLGGNGKNVTTLKTVQATINGKEYATISAAINAAKDGDTVKVMPGTYSSINISNKNITLEGTVGANGELLTEIKGGNPAITMHGFNGTVKNLKITNAFKIAYAEPAGNVTFDNIYATGATYGLHLVAYSKDLTWNLQNSYIDLSWANSFGTYNGGYANINIKKNVFESTTTYYPDYGAPVVNSFSPNVVVEDNVFGANTKIYLRTEEVAENATIGTNYYEDGAENAFVEDSDSFETPISSYYEDREMTTVGYAPVFVGENGYYSVQEAINAANDGAVIEIQPGTYEEALRIEKSVTLKGVAAKTSGASLMADEKPVIIIKDVTNGGVQYYAPNVTLDNIKFVVAEDATGSTWNVSAVGYYYENTVNKDGLTITNCDFVNESDISMSAIAANIGKYTVTNNTFKNFTTMVHSFVDHGAVDEVVISDNRFEDVENIANVYYGAPAGGTANITVTNNKSADGSKAKVIIDDFGMTKATPASSYNTVTVSGNDSSIFEIHNYSSKNFTLVNEGSEETVYFYRTKPVMIRMDGILPDGVVYVRYTDDLSAVIDEMYIVVDGKFKEEAEKVELIFKPNTSDAEALENSVWDMYLVASDGEIINRLNSGDFTFVLDSANKMAYEIIASNDEVSVNNVAGDRYEIHYDGKTNTETDTALEIKIATVKFTGYGTFTFGVKVDGVDTNAVHATTYVDNIVDSYTVGAGLVVNTDTDSDTDGVIESEIVVPTKALTIKVAFPNNVNNNVLAYQKMNVLVTGEDIDDISIDLGTDNTGKALAADSKHDCKYTVVFDEAACEYTVTVENILTVNTAYNVTVSGAGYRTARYTVTMTDAKVLNFWNNVKDNTVEVEEGKASSAVAKNFLAGDIVADNNINIYDLSAVVSYFATDATTDYDKYVKYDLNRDGKIDSKDVAYVLVSWGA